jgi:hypothetical protein
MGEFHSARRVLLIDINRPTLCMNMELRAPRSAADRQLGRLRRVWGPHMGPFHLLSFAFIGGGFIVISAGWRVLCDAQRHHAHATTGIYA